MSRMMPSHCRDVQAYRDARNLLVRLYREDPGRRLTFRDAFRRAEVDADLLLEVWGFLDAWGVINHPAPAEDAPTASGGAASGGAVVHFTLPSVSK